MKATYILWLRQLIRFIRTRSRIFASVAQPILFLVAFGFGLGPIFARAGAGNYINFLAPGIISMSVMFTAVFTGMEIIWDKQFGFLKETLVAPVSRFSIMLGRTLGGATIAFIQGIIVFLITLIVGFRPELGGLLTGAFFMFLIALLFSALGTVVASISEDMQSFPVIMNFVVMPVFFLSGAMFPLDGLNNVLHKIVVFNPLAYGVDAIRGSLTGLKYFSYSTDFLIMSGCIVALIALGAYFFSKLQA